MSVRQTPVNRAGKARMFALEEESGEYRLTPTRLLTKRILDLLISAIVLIVFAPMMLATAAAIRMTMGKPVLYRQQRPGYKGHIFTLYKFRTLTYSRGTQGNLLSDAERLTNLGKFLRSYSIDELPELLNVLKGNLSLVGPRPLLVEYLPRYSSAQMRRHDVLPGITGWAQINGRNALSWEDKFKMDLWYVDNHSLWLDIKILLITLYRVLKREGITQIGQATMEEFKKSTER
jgi:sugar transferase EpsL